ncbi:MAG: PLP-dependent aminotransferase family protein [Thermomicrobiales bacterium]
MDLTDTAPLYRQLEEALAAAIGDGTLAAGDRLPSERALAEQLGVSRTTTVTAYRELEARGLVRGSTGRGTFVCAVETPQAAAPFAWQGKVAAAAQRTNDVTLRSLVQHPTDEVISFMAGQPALEHFPVAAFQRAMQHALEHGVPAALGLGPTEGQPALRLALAQRFGVRAEQVLILSGSQQGLDLLARCLLEPGDVVVMDRPGYLGAIQVFRAAGARIAGWDARRADLDELEDLLQRYRPKLLYTNPTFHNPTGRTLSLETRRGLLQLGQRYRIAIIEDDPYSPLHLDKAPPPSLLSLDDQGVVIYQGTFSKTLAAGLRLSWMIAPEAVAEQVTMVRQRADLFSGGAYQFVVAELLENGVFERHLAALRVEHRARLEAMTTALRQQTPPGALSWVTPEGGLCLWLQAHGHLDVRLLVQQAAALGVEILGGEHFYPDGGGRQEFRLCFTRNPAPQNALGVARLARALHAAEALSGSMVETRPLA